MKVKKLHVLAGFGGSLLLAAGANAAITGVSVTGVDFSNGYVLEDGSISATGAAEVGAAWAAFDLAWDVCRLWVTVDSADSTVGGVGGSVDNSFDLILDAGVGGVFYNSAFGGDTAGSINQAFLGAFPGIAFDSWVTLGTASAAAVDGGPQASITDPNNAFGGFATSVNCQNCGWTIAPAPGNGVYANPTGNTSHRFLIGQFTVMQGSVFSGQVRVAGGGQDLFGLTFAHVPAPGALALLGLAGIAGRRRRRG